MRTVVLAMPGNEMAAAALATNLKARVGRASLRRFPDGESYVRIMTSVKACEVVIVCTMDRPDEKFLSLTFLAATARDLGAKKVGLLCPYLPYMRQDKRFRTGEGITSTYFGDVMSYYFDWIVTIDPHLHRRKKLSEIYRIPVLMAHAAPLISEWIRQHVVSPVVIGPDHESGQWVAAVARLADAAHVVLDKNRTGDRKVKVSRLRPSDHALGTPVVVDDIISSGRTMVATIARLREAGYPAPYCIAIHGIFADRAYQELMRAGARRIVTSNTIPHASNAIDVNSILAGSVANASALANGQLTPPAADDHTGDLNRVGALAILSARPERGTKA